MRIYKDLLTGDEMFSDAYPMSEAGDGMLIEVKGKFVTRTDHIDDKAIGGNASAENVEESALPSTTSGLNIVLGSKLVQTYFTKKEYKTYIKQYVKKIVEELQKCNPDRVPGFKAGAATVVLELIAKVESCEFYIGESMDPDGMVAILEYRENDTPYMIFFKDGLTEEKY
ncbi:hypothetical protein GJAV_G00212090 [Gymnothorax javanicus]|nr:hypothetical protein GJAV_G00212090 [Gymnothorax javanicus]